MSFKMLQQISMFFSAVSLTIKMFFVSTTTIHGNALPLIPKSCFSFFFLLFQIVLTGKEYDGTLLPPLPSYMANRSLKASEGYLYTPKYSYYYYYQTRGYTTWLCLFLRPNTYYKPTPTVSHTRNTMVNRLHRAYLGESGSL